jgi:MoaA/NifB/PqqE/SkfB family radical SAM enzyme
MSELGVLEVTLIGGEAYLRDDWTEIVAAIAARGMSVTMTTGGRGITSERATKGKAAGLESASVSLDAWRRRTTACEASKAHSKARSPRSTTFAQRASKSPATRKSID